MSIDAHTVSSLSASYRVINFGGMGDIVLQARVDNLFDKKYETSGYGGNYIDGSEVAGWAEYFVAAERSFYGQVTMELF